TEGALGMKESVELAQRLAKENGYFLPSQFTNKANVKAHVETSAVEVLNNTEDDLDVFVAGVGTGGTITGVGKVLKEKNKDILIVAVQPEKSPVLTGGDPSGHKIQGLGANFIPEIYDNEVIDEVIDISEEDAFKYARYLGEKKGILVGISAGANFAAAIQVAKRLGKGKRVVVVLPDTGERYLSTALYSE